MVEEACDDLILALKFDPNNGEAKHELSKVEQKCKSTFEKGPLEHEVGRVPSLTGSFANSVCVAAFDLLKLHCLTHYNISSLKKSKSGV